MVKGVSGDVRIARSGQAEVPTRAVQHIYRMVLARWTSSLQTARLALHSLPRPNAAPLRASSSLFPDSSARPTPPHLEFPPTGPIPYDAVPNPLTQSKFSMRVSKAIAPLPKYHFHGIFSRNNTKVYLCGPDGSLLPQGWWSGGSCGFKGANRKSHEAGYQCAVHAFRRLEEVVKDKGRISLALHFAGFGKGRFAVEGVFLTSEGDRIRPLVAEVEDRTKIKIGGTRSKKKRRV